MFFYTYGLRERDRKGGVSCSRTQLDVASDKTEFLLTLVMLTEAD